MRQHRSRRPTCRTHTMFRPKDTPGYLERVVMLAAVEVLGVAESDIKAIGQFPNIDALEVVLWNHRRLVAPMVKMEPVMQAISEYDFEQLRKTRPPSLTRFALW